jgi:hypothetical protein
MVRTEAFNLRSLIVIFRLILRSKLPDVAVVHDSFEVSGEWPLDDSYS